MIRNLYQRFYRAGPAFIGLAALLLAQALSRFPEVTDTVYRQGLFMLYRWTRDTLFSFIPVPMIVVVIVLLLIVLFRGWKRSEWRRFRPWWLGLLNAIGIVVAWFYLSWGFNYAASDVVDVLSLPRKSAGSEQLQQAADRALDEVVFLRSRVDTTRFAQKEATAAEVTAIHSSVRDYLHRIGWETPGNVAMRRVSRAGWMRRLGVAGIYLPFSGEGHVDASYPLLRQWFILAHEYAHGYGVTDEGECNFIAFMALKESGVDRFEYAAWFALADDILPFQAAENDTLKFPEGFVSDRAMLREDAKNYPSFIPGLAAASNDLYLRSQGIEDGLASYQRWVDMVVLAGL